MAGDLSKAGQEINADVAFVVFSGRRVAHSLS
jgi:hypothetical protein